jgi:hypothetical protein
LQEVETVITNTTRVNWWPNLDCHQPRLRSTRVGHDRHTTVGEDLPRWAGFALVGMLDQSQPMPINVDQCQLGWASHRQKSVKVGTSVPMGGSECSDSRPALGERFYTFCTCGVRHRKYFTFSSVNGSAQFCTLMTRVLFSMNELLIPVFYGPSPHTTDIYDLIIRS